MKEFIVSFALLVVAVQDGTESPAEEHSDNCSIFK